MLYGATNSGKSTIMLEILYVLKNHVPNVFVFSPTANSTKDYEGIIPACNIFTEMSVERLEKIYKRQQGASAIYNMVNDVAKLKSIFDLVATPVSRTSAAGIISKASQLIQQINEKKIVGTTIEVNKVRDSCLIKLYKKVITDNKKALSRMNIGDEIKYIIHYLRFNPLCTIVIDDCGSVLSTFQKSTVFLKIIQQGRHDNINLLMSLQDDANVDSNVKKNVSMSFFTTSQCAGAYFERKSNSFPKKIREMAGSIISALYTNSTDYRKLAYIRDNSDPFRYILAESYNFRFGAPVIWQLQDKLSKKEYDYKTDPLLDPFRLP